MIYILVHIVHSQPDRFGYGADECRFIEESVIGVFSSEKDAREEMINCRDLPPLGDHMGGTLRIPTFCIRESDGAQPAI